MHISMEKANGIVTTTKGLNLSGPLLTKNFDQMLKVTSHFVNESNQSFSNGGNEAINNLDNLNLILRKFFVCLKSQHNLNGLFNRLSTQLLFGLLNLIDHAGESAETTEICWKIIKFGLLSKSFANIYMEFFKNLPNSFSPKSNYQVSVLFLTIQTESTKSETSLRSICKSIHIIFKELCLILNNLLEHKIKTSMIQFMFNTIWNLRKSGSDEEAMEVDDSSNDQEKSNLIISSLTNMLKVVNDLNLINLIEDQNNESMFRNWVRGFVKETSVLDFNEQYSSFLIEIIRIDHLILDADFKTVLSKLNEHNNLAAFLCSYLEAHVKFRQLSKLVSKLIECLESDEAMSFPFEFYSSFSASLENYSVDTQTVINLWKEVCKRLNTTTNKTNMKVELVKMLNSILSRVNLTSQQRMPLHLKNQSLELLSQSRSYLNSQLMISKKNKLTEDQETIACLDCYYTCGYLYLLMYRFSATTAPSTSTIVHSESSKKELEQFLTDMNETFKLRERIASAAGSFKLLFFLTRLELINVYALNVLTNSNIKLSYDALLNEDHLTRCYKLKKSHIELIQGFNILTNIKDESVYTILASKLLVLDNIYAILPLVRNNSQEKLQQCLRSILYFIAQHGSVKNRLEIEPVNSNALFNDNHLVKYILIALIQVLRDHEDESDSESRKKRSKFFSKLTDICESDFESSLIESAFESKKISGVTLNERQIENFYQICEYMPVEFLSARHGTVLYLINERVDMTQRSGRLYTRLFQSEDIFELIPTSRIESNLLKLLNVEDSSFEMIEKVMKKGVSVLMREQNIDSLITFVDKLFEAYSSGHNSDLISMTLIQTLERVYKVREHAISQNDEYLSKLKSLFKRIISHFVKSHKEEDDQVEIDQYTFSIGSILVYQIGSSKSSFLEYLKKLLESCLKHHKKIKKLVKRKDSVSISSYYVEFLKSAIVNANNVNSLLEDEHKVDPVQLTKDLVLLFTNVDSLKLNLTGSSMVQQKMMFDCGNEEAKINQAYISRVLVSVFNSLDVNQFREVLDYELVKFGDDHSYYQLAKLVKLLSSDFDLDARLKEECFMFIQKFLVQVPGVYASLMSNVADSKFISLLECHSAILSSKYFLLPSHLVLSILQIYVSIDYERLKLESFALVQELALVTLNTIITRYSKKFVKLAAVICTLLTKLIRATTSFSNQNLLEESQVDLAAKCAQNLERMITHLQTFKKEFSKLSPYMISEFLGRANTIPIHLSCKSALMNSVYSLISLCDLHGISQLHVALPVGPKEIFKTVYAEYEKYHKYTGKV